MRYAKTLAQVVSAVALAVLAALVTSDDVTASEWVNVVLAGVTVLPVFYVANTPSASIAKAVVASVTPLFVLLSNLIGDGFTQTEIWQLVAAAAGALLVYAVPNVGAHARGTAYGHDL